MRDPCEADADKQEQAHSCAYGQPLRQARGERELMSAGSHWSDLESSRCRAGNRPIKNSLT